MYSMKLVSKLSDSYIDSLDLTNLYVEQWKLEKKIRLENLDWDIFNSLLNNSNETELKRETEWREEYQTELDKCCIKISEQIKVLLVPSSQTISNISSSLPVPNQMRLSLPAISLPEFSGNVSEDGHTFLDNLENRLALYNLNNTKKYGILESQTSGRALAMIKSLNLVNNSYSAAKVIRLQAFADVIKQKFAIIQKLISLKLKSEGDSVLFFAEICKLIDAVRELKIDPGTFLQYFMWEAIPFQLQEHIINVSSTSFPDINQTKSNYLMASQRYENHKTKKSVKNLSVSVNLNASQLKTQPSEKTFSKTQYPCSFYFSNDHKNAQCPKYTSAKSKNNRIREF